MGIPKIIHYCWFGGNPLPDLAKQCIASWKRWCPDYIIKEWNETNFDLDCCDYVQEAYQAGKWAFVSDYARFWILYHEGGLYFDTDVELIRPLNEIVAQGSFMGCEPIDPGTVDYRAGANPGLGVGAYPGLDFYKEMLDFYQTHHFLKANGDIDTTTIVEYTSNMLKRHGWNEEGSIQKVSEITVYPPEYFCPMDYITGQITITPNTYSIHHYSASWHGKYDAKILSVSRFCINHFGRKAGKKLSRIFDFPLRVGNKVEHLGIKGTLKFSAEKLLGHTKS